MWWSHSAVQFQQRYLFFLSYLCSCYRHWHWLFFVCVCIPRLNHKQIELANAEEKMLGIQKQWNVKFSQCISNSSSILLVYCDCCFFVSWLLSCKSWTPVILMLLTLTLASCVCALPEKSKQLELDNAQQLMIGRTYDRMAHFMSCTLLGACKIRVQHGKIKACKTYCINSHLIACIKLTLRNRTTQAEKEKLVAENLGIVDQSHWKQYCDSVVIL